MSTNGDALIETRKLSKYFGSVIAIKDISMLVHPGRVTCLLGDNGAGKSTLIKTLSGVYEPSEGEYLCDGEEIHLKSPRDALARGIATVYQDLAMIPLLSIWRNFFLGSEPTKGWGPFRRFDVKKAKEITREELSKMGIDIRDPEQAVGTLSGGERQSLAIARAVYFGARVLILDEPTAALGVKQAGVVLRYIVTAKQRGVAVVFITHNPHHAYPVGDHFVILRRGKVFGSFPKAELTLEHLVQMMAGGAELETLAHELQQVAGDDAELQKAVAVLEQEVKAVAPEPVAAEPPSPAAGRRGGARPRTDVDASGPYDLVTMGRVGVDLYPEQSGVPLAEVRTFAKSLGGSPTNVAVGAARYGHRVAVITKVGADGFGDYVHAALRGFGVDDRFVGTDPELRTPIVFCELLPPESPTILFYRQPSAPDMQVSAGELDLDAIRDARIFWTTGTGLSAEPSRTATLAALEARDRGAHHRARPRLPADVLVDPGRRARAAAPRAGARDGRGRQRRGVRRGGGGRIARGPRAPAARPRSRPRDREARGRRRPGGVGGTVPSDSRRCRSTS